MEGHSNPWVKDSEDRIRWYTWYNSEEGREQRELDAIYQESLKKKEQDEVKARKEYEQEFIKKYKLEPLFDPALSNPLAILLSGKGLSLTTLVSEASDKEYRDNQLKEAVRNELLRKE